MTNQARDVTLDFLTDQPKPYTMTNSSRICWNYKEDWWVNMDVYQLSVVPS